MIDPIQKAYDNARDGIEALYRDAHKVGQDDKRIEMLIAQRDHITEALRIAGYEAPTTEEALAAMLEDVTRYREMCAAVPETGTFGEASAKDPERDEAIRVGDKVEIMATKDPQWGRVGEIGTVIRVDGETDASVEVRGVGAPLSDDSGWFFGPSQLKVIERTK